MPIEIVAISSYLPAGTLTNSDLNANFPEWSADRISEKTGISIRHIADSDEYSSTLAIRAAESLLADNNLEASSIDYLIVVTQTPDYILPGVSQIVHEAIGLRSSTGAIDVNQGCSGYVYALGLAKGLIESGQCARVMVLTTDTYSKLIHPEDKSVRTIFGDGATASLVAESEIQGKNIDSFVYGTDGSGAGHLIVPTGGLRDAGTRYPKTRLLERGLSERPYGLFMNGPEIFNFTIRIAHNSLERILEKSDLRLEDIDIFVFHQANKFMLEHLKSKLEIPEAKFPIVMQEFGNTVSSTIPMTLEKLKNENRLEGKKVLLLGFGVGLSWAGCILRF